MNNHSFDQTPFHIQTVKSDPQSAHDKSEGQQ